MADETAIADLPFPELEDTADVPRDIKALADKVAPSVVPVGAIMMWPGAAPPNEAWLLCDGDPLGLALAVDYPDLATVLGVTGSPSRVKIPNMVGRVAVGAGPLPSASPAKTAGLGSSDGKASIKLTGRASGIQLHSHAASQASPAKALTTVAVGNHAHAIDIAGGQGGQVAPVSGSLDNAFGPTKPFSLKVGTQHATVNIPVTGIPNHAHGCQGAGAHGHTVGGNTADRAYADAQDAHDNMPPYYAINHIIRAK